MEIIPFEQRISNIQEEINRRRAKWVLSTVDFEDASQIILLRVFLKYKKLYDPQKSKIKGVSDLFAQTVETLKDEMRSAKPRADIVGSLTLQAKQLEKKIFTHWLNRVITNAIRNIWRDNLTKFSRPCILGCKFNLGDDACGYTASKKQCVECPLFKEWKTRKEDHFNVKQSLPLENHTQEVNNMPHDFLDIANAKKRIDEKMKEKLKPFEWSLYSLLYIKNKTPEEAGKILKYKKCKNSNVPGYQQIKKFEKRIVLLAKEIISEENLA